MSNNPLIDISKVYMEQIAETDQTEAYTVTAADKKGNTPAWKAYQKGKKNVKTGEPLYKAADHLKNEDKDWGYDKEGNSLNPADIEKKNRKEDKLFGSPKAKKESVSNWRVDLKDLIEIVAEPEEKAEKEVKEKSNIKKEIGTVFKDMQLQTLTSTGKPCSGLVSNWHSIAHPDTYTLAGIMK